MRYLILLIAFIFSALLPLKSMAEQVTVPITHFPPWKIIEQSNQFSGINIEITRALLHELDLEPNFVVRPGKRCFLMLKTGQADMMSGLLQTKERNSYLIFINPPYKTKSTKAFYVNRLRGTQIKSYADLQELTIGTTLGSRYFKKFDEDMTLKKEPVASNMLNLKKLIAGRIDAFICTETVADYMISKNKFGPLLSKASYSYDKPTPVYFAVSRNSPFAKRIPELSAAMEKIIESGEVDRIMTKYISGAD